MAVDLPVRDLSAATGELERRDLRETKRHADLDGTRHAARSQKFLLGSAELLSEEGLADTKLEFGSYQQEAVVDNRRVRLERRGRRLSATTTRFSATVAIPRGIARRSRKRTLHRMDGSRDGIQAD